MLEQYEVEKWIWTDADFEQMGWHDSWVYAIAFLPETFEFALDLDYIFRWVHPAPGETYFKFWVVPATLVFSDVDELNINLEIGYGGGLEIADINRTDPQEIQAGDYAGQNTWRYVIETQEGEISLRAYSYKQYIRKKPVFGQAQALEMDVRGGVSFYRGRLDE
jgi:hypothetical protein